MKKYSKKNEPEVPKPVFTREQTEMMLALDRGLSDPVKWAPDPTKEVTENDSSSQ